jgi:hypothetical protein
MVTHAKQRSIEADALRELAAFPLVEALYGRRSRRFALGDEIPDGPLAYRSTREPVSLTELERMLVLTAMAGTTGWHYAITRHSIAAPTLVLAGGSDLTARPRLSRRRRPDPGRAFRDPGRRGPPAVPGGAGRMERSRRRVLAGGRVARARGLVQRSRPFRSEPRALTSRPLPDRIWVLATNQLIGQSPERSSD